MRIQLPIAWKPTPVRFVHCFGLSGSALARRDTTLRLGPHQDRRGGPRRHCRSIQSADDTTVSERMVCGFVCSLNEDFWRPTTVIACVQEKTRRKTHLRFPHYKSLFLVLLHWRRVHLFGMPPLPTPEATPRHVNDRTAGMGLVRRTTWHGRRISERLQCVGELVIEANAAPPGTYDLERAAVVHVPHHLHEHRRYHIRVQDGSLLKVVLMLRYGMSTRR